MEPVSFSTLILPEIELCWGSMTDTGKVRQFNEDSMFAEPGVFVVADGMGGHAAGDVASRLTIEAFSAIVTGGPLELSAIADVVSDANRRVRDHAQLNGLEGMGATVVGALLVDNAGEDSLVVFNVGDARCYALVDGRLSQLTTDHSLVQEMVDQGELLAELARTHPQRNVVTRAIGIEPVVAADFVIAPHEGSMKLLLCSDGVHGELSDDRIAELLAAPDDPQDIAQSIIDEVLLGRAADNATAVVITVVRPLQQEFRPAEEEIEVTGPRPTVVIPLQTNEVSEPLLPPLLSILPPPATEAQAELPSHVELPSQVELLVPSTSPASPELLELPPVGLIDSVPATADVTESGSSNTLIDDVPT